MFSLLEPEQNGASVAATRSPSRPTFVAGLDLAQAVDWTALVVLQAETGEPGTIAQGTGRFVVRAIERTRNQPYPAIVSWALGLLNSPQLRGRCALVVDHTGVGRAAVDLLRQGGRPDLLAVTITGGNIVTRDGRELGVPKRDLITALEVLVESGRLEIVRQLRHSETLLHELGLLERRVTPAGHDTYGVWRTDEHDDLLLGLALAAWWADQGAGSPVRFY